MNRFVESLRKGGHGVKARAGIGLAGAALFLLAFLLGIHLFFPAVTVQQWLAGEIAARTPVSVKIDRLSLRPLFTLSAPAAVVAFDNRTQPVVLDEIRLKPLWSALVTSNPGLSMDAVLLQGQLAAAIRSNGDFTLHATGVKLADFTVYQEPRTLLSGTLVKGELRGSSPARKNSENRLLVELDNGSVTVMGQPLVLGKIVIDGAGQGNTLRIARLTASGGDLAIAGTGTLLLGSSAAASRINLDLSLRPAATAPPALATLLELVAKRQDDGSYRLRLSGPPGRLTLD